MTDTSPDERAVASPTGRWALAAAVVTAVAYLPVLRRGFASEDFLILAALDRMGVLEGFARHLQGPWLGLEIVSFYRPLSTAIFHALWELFGARPAALLAAHALLHAACVVLAARLFERLARTSGSSVAPGSPGRVAAAAALAFGLFPLHANAVAFLASFATLYSTFFVLAFFLTLTEPAAPTLRAARSLPLLAAALLCYEQAVAAALFAPLLAWTTAGGSPAADACPDAPAPERRRLRRMLRADALGPLLLGGAFLLLRGAALGAGVGGYEEFRSRLLQPGVLLAALRDQLTHLVLPQWEVGVPAIVGWLLAPAAVTFVLYAAAKRTEAGSSLVLLGAVWYLLAQAPMSFPGIVPANGRYLSLSVFGLLLALMGALALLFGAEAGRRGVVAPATLTALAALWGVFLQVHLQQMVDAGAEADRLRAAVAERTGARALVVSGTPAFLRNQRGIPVAQVFNWGLADALQAPFHGTTQRVYPVRSGTERFAVPALPHADVAVWRAEESRLDDVHPAEVPSEPCARVRWSGDEETPALRLETAPPFRAGARSVLLTGLREIITPVEPAGDRVPLPADAIRTSQRLYPDLPVLAWVEWLEELPPSRAPSTRRRCTSAALALPRLP